MHHRRNRPDQRGVALVSVLLLLAGLIAIATAVITLSTAQRRAAQRAEESDARKVLLDSALRIALAEIAYPKPDGPFWYPDQPRTLKVGTRAVDVSLQRETGRIDLNMAEDKFLVAALAVNGFSEADARAGAARIRDWTDADEERRLRGAERADYRQAGLSHEPRNAPMESIEELRQVMGLHALTDEALDLFTVYSQQREPATSEASEEVQETLRWLARAAGEGGFNAPATATSPSPTNVAVSYAGTVVRLRACVSDAQNFCRTVVVRFTGARRQPWHTFVWR